MQLCPLMHIRSNVNNHQCECLPVLKEEGIKSWSCRHCVPALCTLLKKQFKPGLTATFIACNYLPQHCMACTIQKGMNHKHIGWLCITNAMVVMQGLMPLKLAIFHAFEQPNLYLMRTQIQCKWLPVLFCHVYHPQDGRVHWVND